MFKCGETIAPVGYSTPPRRTIRIPTDSGDEVDGTMSVAAGFHQSCSCSVVKMRPTLRR
jgi:hypothetical protein